MLSSSYLQPTLPETGDYSLSPHLWMGQVEQNKIADQKFFYSKKGSYKKKVIKNHQLMTKKIITTGQGPLQNVMKGYEPLDDY